MNTVKRLAARTAIFFALTVLAFAIMRPLTQATGHSDVLKCMTAAAVLAWAEITITWLRVFMSPRVDEQEAVTDVHELADPLSLAVLYCAHSFKWAMRLGAFIYLYSGVL